MSSHECRGFRRQTHDTFLRQSNLKNGFTKYLTIDRVPYCHCAGADTVLSDRNSTLRQVFQRSEEKAEPHCHSVTRSPNLPALATCAFVNRLKKTSLCRVLIKSKAL